MPAGYTDKSLFSSFGFTVFNESLSTPGANPVIVEGRIVFLTYG